MDFVRYMLERHYDQYYDTAEEGVIRDVADSIHETAIMINWYNLKVNTKGMEELVKVAAELNNNFKKINMDNVDDISDLSAQVFKRKKKEFKQRILNTCKKNRDESYYKPLPKCRSYYERIKTSLVKSLRDEVKRLKKYQSFRKKRMIGKFAKQMETFMKQCLAICVDPHQAKYNAALNRFCRAVWFTGIFELFMPDELDAIFSDIGGFQVY